MDRVELSPSRCWGLKAGLEGWLSPPGSLLRALRSSPPPCSCAEPRSRKPAVSARPHPAHGDCKQAKEQAAATGETAQRCGLQLNPRIVPRLAKLPDRSPLQTTDDSMAKNRNISLVESGELSKASGSCRSVASARCCLISPLLFCPLMSPRFSFRALLLDIAFPNHRSVSEGG